MLGENEEACWQVRYNIICSFALISHGPVIRAFLFSSSRNFFLSISCWLISSSLLRTVSTSICCFILRSASSLFLLIKPGPSFKPQPGQKFGSRFLPHAHPKPSHRKQKMVGCLCRSQVRIRIKGWWWHCWGEDNTTVKNTQSTPTSVT